ncbi:fimbrillin family protein, partial [Bacteroides heparinolyticus]|uniref:fimbrillin family protein n=1 Tax=Prevotella heparinolytica TaxID=28113 RepID=UPI0035A071FF
PHHCAGVTLTTGIGTPGAPSFSYTVPAAVSDQTDLLTASSVDVAGVLHAPAPLAFRHALTAVRFETGNPLLPGTVTKITLKGVYGTATHRIGESTWSAYSGVRDFGQVLNVTTPDPNVLGSPITQPSATFMMIPQTLPAGAQLEVVYTDKLTNTQRTLTASIAGKVWGMGKTVTYRISTSSISVVPRLNVIAPGDFEHTGGTQNYTVSSYLEVTRPGDATKTLPMAWTVEYSTDNGLNWSSTKPAWLTTFTESGPGGNTPATHQATAAAQVKVMHEPNNDNLRAASPKTNWNLSNATGADAVQNTANCYVVNAPGTYRLPLVYGNAIKNGSTNASAYTSTASGANVLTTFINHLGNAITNPYIGSNAGCTPANATLVWQDEQNLVTGVGLSGGFLTFTVAQSSIKQGNAVVAVRDASNTILWSWHIWVTDYVLGTGLKTITNFQNKQYTLLPVNIGWCDEKRENYAGREVKVRFKQQVTAGYPGTTETVTVKQKAYEFVYIGNNPYFQFGRKDPMLPGILNSANFATDKQCYTTNSAYAFNREGTGKVNIGIAIKTPYMFYNYGSGINQDWCSPSYANLWSLNNTVYTDNDNIVKKTIYDPSPIGYSLSPSNVFTGFTTTGQNSTTPSQFNISGAFNKGFNFYCGLNWSGSTLFFPATSWRNHLSGGLGLPGTNALYWSAGPVGATQGGAAGLSFSPGVDNPLFHGSRAYAAAVRPCKEQ